jgi:hypothetical protein
MTPPEIELATFWLVAQCLYVVYMYNSSSYHLRCYTLDADIYNVDLEPHNLSLFSLPYVFLLSLISVFRNPYNNLLL